MRSGVFTRTGASLAIVSLLLSVFAAALWARSYWTIDLVDRYWLDGGTHDQGRWATTLGVQLLSYRGWFEIAVIQSLDEIDAPETTRLSWRNSRLASYPDPDRYNPLANGEGPPASQRFMGAYFFAGGYRNSVWLGIRYLWLVLLFSILPARAGWLLLRQRRRHRRGLCVACGYDLHGNLSGICPECGRPAAAPVSAPRCRPG